MWTITNYPQRLGERPSREAARGVEQALIEHYGRQRDRLGNELGGSLENVINSIAESNEKYEPLVQQGQDLLKALNILPGGD